MKVLLFTIVLLCVSLCTYSQESQSTADKIADFPTRFLDKLNKKASHLEDKVLNYSEKTLRRLEKQEKKLYKKLYKKDSIAAKQLLQSGQEGYSKLREQLAGGGNAVQRGRQYLSRFDTLNTSLKFLSQNAGKLITNQQALQGKLQGATKSMAGLSDKLQQAEAIQKYLKDRRQLLRDNLQRVGLVKELRKYNQQAYYYAAQIKEYKAILEDPKRLEQKAIGLLRKLPLFQKFMQQHSELAALFPEPANYGTLQSLAGLQTRASVQNLIQQQIAAGGPNAQAMIQQNLQAAQGMLNQLKDKVLKSPHLGEGQGEVDIPEDLKVNPYKTKRAKDRLEFGTNLQSTRAGVYWPVTTDIGLSVGYRLNPSSVVGIAGAYKLGLGKDIRNIRLSHQGIGFRTFMDWKLKGAFFISGGAEWNYRSEFKRVEALKNFSYWQRSALVGLSKTVSIKSKFFKKTKIQIMYDLLWRTEVPTKQPLVFRTGYNF